LTTGDTAAQNVHSSADSWSPAFLAYYQRYEARGFWAAVEMAAGDFLGWFHFWPQEGAPSGEIKLRYRLRTSAWCRGYTAESSRALR
jgi:RimJ/RimL family protein N-acetyltransferase